MWREISRSERPPTPLTWMLCSSETRAARAQPDWILIASALSIGVRSPIAMSLVTLAPPNGTIADVEQHHAQVALVAAQHRVARGQRLEHQVGDLEAGALDRAADVLGRGHGAGDDVDLGFEPHAAHPDRVLDPVLVVDDELLRDHVDDLAIGGDRDRLGGLHHAVDVGGTDLVVLAGDRDHAAAVDRADVVAGDPGGDALHRKPGHALGLVHGALDAGHGLLEVHHHAAAQTLAGGVADSDHAHGGRVVPVGVRDDAGDLGGADVEPDVRPCRLCHCAHLL